MVGTSDLIYYWNGFQSKFNDWYKVNYANAELFTEGFCWDDRIRNFCDAEFSTRHCQRYCDHPLCRLYWTQQAKVCCESCGQDSCINVEPTCLIPSYISTQFSTVSSTTEEYSPSTKKTTTTTTTTNKATITTTRKAPVFTTDSSFTTNASMYTKQPFGKSPFVSIPIGLGILLVFILVYRLRMRFKRSSENSSNDRNQPSISMNEIEMRPCAPPDDQPTFSVDETNIQIILSPESHENATYDAPPPENQSAYDAPPSYNDCVTIAPPSYDSQTDGRRDTNTYTGGSLHNDFNCQ